MTKNPCYQNGQHCTKRVLGCQATCKDYAQYFDSNRAREAQKRKEYVILESVTDREIRRQHREHITGGRNK